MTRLHGKIEERKLSSLLFAYLIIHKIPTVNIPASRYSLETFLDYVAENLDDVFSGSENRKWLKAHLVYSIRDWRSIFEDLQLLDYGDITYITFNSRDSKSSNEPNSINFYVYEWEPGLLVIFTSSTKEDYERTLKELIISKRGLMQSWIAPWLLDNVKNYLLDNYGAKIYRFISRRYRHWKFPSRIRPEYDRRHSYSGKDADETLDEMQELYGVIPSSIDMNIGDSKIQINRNGLFVIRHINRKTLGILQDVIERVVAEQIRIRNISEKFKISTKRLQIHEQVLKVSRVVAGKIILPNTVLSRTMINDMFLPSEEYELGHLNSLDTDDDIHFDFSFLDTSITEQPLIFTATVVDETKRTIFGISGNENEMTIIPKHRITFESFIGFYNFVIENFDREAKMKLFSEIIYD